MCQLMENVGYVYMRVVTKRDSHSLEIVLAVVVLDCKYILFYVVNCKCYNVIYVCVATHSTFSSDKHELLTTILMDFSAHLSCIIEYATTKSNENHKDICKFTQPWEVCPNCNQCCKYAERSI